MRLEAVRIESPDIGRTWQFGRPATFVLTSGERMHWRSQLDTYLTGHGTSAADEVYFGSDETRDLFIEDFGPL